MSPARSSSGFRISFITLTTLLTLLGLVVLPGAVRGSPPLDAANFTLAAPQGFGDRNNSWAWSMQWWNGHLYVGTNRALLCATQASLNYLFGDDTYPYPPNEPDVECTPDPHDLPLQAEIWRWTPPNTWERVYQAPNNVPIPNSQGKFVARDVAYRGMTIFKEPDGTEALYVGSVSPRLVYGQMPPPRILRSTDGVNFAPLPQDAGTFLGDVQFASFRNPVSYNGRFYIQGGSSQGAGVLLEADNPAAGNDNFRQVSPFGMTVSAVTPYNGALYLGTEDLRNGYSVFKTDAKGSPPYTFTPIIEKAGYLTEPNRPPSVLPNVEILSMKVFQNRLYLGANGVATLLESQPAELMRVNPDDTWDIVVGNGRDTPTGRKEPISGIPGGFGNPYNNHMWRMEVFDGNLYLGTFDSSTAFRNDPGFPQDILGFDLYRTADGTNFVPITTTGFGDKFNFGVRNMAATPYGLFVGTANYYYGLKIYRGLPADFKGFKMYVPGVTTAAP